MNARPIAIAVMSGLLALAASAQGRTASNKELEARANEIDARLGTVERANENLVPMQQQVESARAELRTLRGQIEEARHELETLRQQQRDLYGDLDRRLLLLEHGAAPTVPSGTAPPSEDQIRADDEASVYGDAFAALKAGRYEDAVREGDRGGGHRANRRVGPEDAARLGVEECSGPVDRVRVESNRRGARAAGLIGVEEGLGGAEDQGVDGQ